MSEALIAAAADLARAQHQVVDRFQQPGNDYRPEVRCRCGWWGWASGFEEHRARAALEAAEAKSAELSKEPESE